MTDGVRLPRITDDFARYVYAFRRKDGLVKIGITYCLHRRQGQLENGMGEALIFLGAIPCPGGLPQATHLEMQIHIALQRYRTRGEWFYGHPAVHRVIAEMFLAPPELKVWEEEQTRRAFERMWALEEKARCDAP